MPHVGKSVKSLKHIVDDDSGVCCMVVVVVLRFQVYPTTIRALSLGTCNALSRLGALITPFISQVKHFRGTDKNGVSGKKSLSFSSQTASSVVNCRADEQLGKVIGLAARPRYSTHYSTVQL